MKFVKRNIKLFVRLLVLVVGAFVEICLCGCSDKVEFKWFGRRNMAIAGFIDDSMLVAYDCRGWLETTETWSIGDGYSEKSSCGHDRLLVYNYRVQEDGPRWSDSLTNKSGGYRWYQLTDSVFWRWDGNEILLWKLGETAHKMKLSRKNDGCLRTFEINRMRQWLGGNFIALGGGFSTGGDDCQYAVLDTIERTLTYKRLDKDLEWIEKCDDIRAWGKDVYCVILKKENEISIVLKNEKILISSPILFYIGGFWGNMIKLNGNICSLVNDEITCSDVTWRGTLMFYKDGIVIVDLGKEL